MFPVDIKNMQRMMSQLGIKQKSIEAKEVIIKTSEKDLVIKEPKVIEIEMKGIRSYQITGKMEEKNFSEDDIRLVMERTGATRENVERALEKHKGNLAEAILELGG